MNMMAATQKDDPPIPFHKIARFHHDLRGQGQRLVRTFKQTGELRHQERHEQAGYEHTGHEEKGRVNQSRDHAALKFGDAFQILSLTLEDDPERARDFTGGGHRAIKFAEIRRRRPQRGRKTPAVAHLLAQQRGDLFERAEFIPAFHDPERRLELEARTQQITQLLGEQDDLFPGQPDRPLGQAAGSIGLGGRGRFRFSRLLGRFTGLFRLLGLAFSRLFRRGGGGGHGGGAVFDGD
jgi:hypothetical protein